MVPISHLDDSTDVENPDGASSLSNEKRLDHQQCDEYCEHKTDDSARESSPGPGLREYSVVHGLSDEMNKNESDGCQPLLEAVNDRSSRNRETEVSTKTKDRSARDYEAVTAKPLKPFRHEQRRSAYRNVYHNTYGRSRLSNAHSHYGDDYVSHPKHYRGSEKKRQPKDVKATADAAGNNSRNEFNEDMNDSQFDHKECNSAALTESKPAVLPGSKEHKSQSPQRQSRGYCRYQSARDQQTLSDSKAVSTLATTASTPQQYPTNSSDTCNNVEMKSRTQKRRPRKRRNKRAPDKIHSSSAENNEQLQKSADASSHLSTEACKSDDLQSEPEAGDVVNDSSASAKQKYVKQAGTRRTSTGSCSQEDGCQKRRNNHTRQNDTDSTKEPITRQRHGEDCAHDSASRGEKEQWRRNGGRRNFRHGNQLHNNNHAEHGAADVVKDSSTSAEQNHMKQADVCHTNTDGCSEGQDFQKRRKNHTYLTKETTKHDDQIYGKDRAGESYSRIEKEHYQRSGASRRGGRRNFHQESQPSNNQSEHTAVDLLKDSSTSAEQTRVKQADGRQMNTDGCSEGLGSQNRRNNPTYFTKAPTTRDDQKCGKDQANVSYSRREKEHRQRNGGSRGGERRIFRQESWTSNSQHNYDNQSVLVDQPTKVPSAKPQHSEFDTCLHPPGFCTQQRPVSATARLPTS